MKFKELRKLEMFQAFKEATVITSFQTILKTDNSHIKDLDEKYDNYEVVEILVAFNQLIIKVKEWQRDTLNYKVN